MKHTAALLLVLRVIDSPVSLYLFVSNRSLKSHGARAFFYARSFLRLKNGNQSRFPFSKTH